MTKLVRTHGEQKKNMLTSPAVTKRPDFAKEVMC
jgi:hypothetical protein